ncbi:MAG: DNA mismatch repair endonuclease MutL [Phototrophicaceae bacterium]
MAIQRLHERVIAQIAAGEVIERPASVVKELLENSIDAQATSIQIDILGTGTNQIRVSDNGKGINPDEVELALVRHATSKLQNIDDLDTITTLGFRGEALASISAVSRMILTSRHESASVGVQVITQGGEVEKVQRVGIPNGTVVTVENLFFNTPARLKFLKSDSTEKRHVAAVVMNYAMAYPHIRFVLSQDGREQLHTHGTGNLADALVSILGIEEFSKMVDVQWEKNATDVYRVHGYTSIPDYSRADRSRITLFVNGRAVQDSKLGFAVVQAYHTFLMQGRFPIAILCIDVNPAFVDVNVHPAKAEVRFSDPNVVFSAVQRAVRQAILQNTSPIVNTRSAPSSSTPYETHPLNEQVPLNLSDGTSGQFARQYDLYQPTQTVDPITQIPSGMDSPLKPRSLPMLRVVGQISASYIIAEGPSGMYLIDQHAAHERILYEQFMEEHAKSITRVQLALENDVIQLAPLDAQLIEEYRVTLLGLGIELESFGGGMFKVRSVPALLSHTNPQAIIATIVSDLENGKTPTQEAIEERIVKRICKQVAVKAGQVLSLTEMQGIIRQLERCVSPHTCPHGRPTIIHMSADQLAREFGRVGKR